MRRARSASVATPSGGRAEVSGGRGTSPTAASGGRSAVSGGRRDAPSRCWRVERRTEARFNAGNQSGEPHQARASLTQNRAAANAATQWHSGRNRARCAAPRSHRRLRAATDLLAISARPPARRRSARSMTVRKHRASSIAPASSKRALMRPKSSYWMRRKGVKSAPHVTAGYSPEASRVGELRTQARK
jgi:hypothetical protein